MSEDSQNQLRERLLSRVARTLEGYIDFHDELAGQCEPGWPTFSQSIRIKALLDNKRILVADDTGVNGKTFTGVASKFCLDKQSGKRNPTLVVAPNCGMINAWSQSEINRYAGYMNTSEQKVVTVRDYEELNKVDPETDFAVVNWEKLSIREGDKRWRSFDSAVARMAPQLFIFDECHNAKGSSSLRAQSVKRLTEYTKDKSLILLSATPIPNRYRDLAMIFHMLDPVKYPSPTMFSHCPPDVIKELLDRQVWFRLTRQDLKQELGLPEFREVEVPVDLSYEEAEAYFKAWEDCVFLGEGLTELRKTLYDPRLSKYGATIDKPSSKLEQLAKLTGELTSKGQKVIIKTNYVTDIIQQIADAVGKDKEVLVVSGETPLEDRKARYCQFRNNPNQNILVTSQVSEESVDLTTGDVPVSLITFEPEMTPREFIQFTGRVYRRGQRAPVTHYTLVTQSQDLDNMMTEYIGTLSKKYGFRVPKKFRPRTIDSDMLAMRRAKGQIVNTIYGGEHISKTEERVYDADEVNKAVAHLEGLLSPTTFRSIGDFELSSIIQARWRNLGEEQFGRLVHSKGWRKWRKLYENGWEGSASNSTLGVIGKLVDGIEAKLGYEPVIVDEGSGAAYFSRATGRKAVCLDLDERFLERGKKICEKLGIENKYLAAPATATSLPKNSADIVVNSYMIFYLGQDDKRHEIEDCIIEANRIIKPNGHFIVALPYTIDEQVLQRFSENIQSYGFRRVQYLGRNETKNSSLKNGCYILDFEKTSSTMKRHGLDLSFYNNQRRFVG
jgi:superfamily II DNA or RNA helicase/SAM-dependent methyltransferase